MLWSHSLSTELILSERIDHHTGDNDLYDSLQTVPGFLNAPKNFIHARFVSRVYGLSSLSETSNRLQSMALHLKAALCPQLPRTLVPEC